MGVWKGQREGGLYSKPIAIEIMDERLRSEHNAYGSTNCIRSWGYNLSPLTRDRRGHPFVLTAGKVTHFMREKVFSLDIIFPCCFIFFSFKEKFFIQNFWTHITKFVTRITKFVIHIQKCWIKTFKEQIKIFKHLGRCVCAERKKYKGANRNLLRDNFYLLLCA